MKSYWSVGPHLGVTEQTLKGYDRSHKEYETKKLNMLQDWKRKNGSRATYLALVKGLLEAEDRTTAEAVARYAKDKLVDTSADKLVYKKTVCYNLCIIPGDHNKTKENSILFKTINTIPSKVAYIISLFQL